jgi:hypothetical protein
VTIKAINFRELLVRAQGYSVALSEHPSEMQPSFRFSFKNIGKTPAVVQEISWFLEVSELPPDPVYTTDAQEGEVIEPGSETITFTAEMKRQISLGELESIRLGQRTFWLAGRIDYEDVFGQRRTHRFYQRYVRLKDGLRFGLQSFEFEQYNRSS